MDLSTIAAGLARPGGDTRQWCSFGTVDPETDEQKSTRFDPDQGPMVSVTLQPSGKPVECRVAGQVAGNGEADWYPFVDGDEVIVAIPEGDERAGPVILGRLNNAIDKFPTRVAGNDPTTNTFGFRRTRAPHVVETAAAWGVRNAANGALLMLEASGVVTVKGGKTSDFLRLSPDFVGLQASDDDSELPVTSSTATTLILQLDKVNKLARLEVQGQTELVLGVSSSHVSTNGTFSVAASGAIPAEHVATVEAVVNIVHNVLMAMGLAMLVPVGNVPVNAVGAFLNPGTVLAIVNAGIAACAGPTGTVAPFSAAMAAALAAKLPNPTGLLPSIGCPGFVAG